MLGARLLSTIGATVVDAQVGNPNDGIVQPKQRGAVAGDYALWLYASTPTAGWTLLTNNPTNVYGKQLTASDLVMTGAPNQTWGMVIYRDVTSVAVRSPAGFTKSPGHIGVAGFYFATSGGYPQPPLASPPGAQGRLFAINGPYFALYDVVAPADPYPDGAPFGSGSADFWTALELLRS